MQAAAISRTLFISTLAYTTAVRATPDLLGLRTGREINSLEDSLPYRHYRVLVNSY